MSGPLAGTCGTGRRGTSSRPTSDTTTGSVATTAARHHKLECKEVVEQLGGPVGKPAIGCLLAYSLGVDWSRGFDDFEYRILDARIAVVKMDKELVQRVVDASALVGLGRGGREERHHGLADSKADLVRGVIQALQQRWVELENRLLSKGAGQGAEEVSEAEAHELSSRCIVVIQIRLENGQKGGRRLEEARGVGVACTKDLIETSDGDLAHCRCNSSRSPDEIVGQRGLDQRQGVLLPALRQLSSGQKSL
mmetsp:Transcript_4205/g.12449  ORF Transcript_4205/g.12449 Transcript_4205/m.12449 type:complete len:251 (+) Transcript_4205:203-955(+)